MPRYLRCIIYFLMVASSTLSQAQTIDTVCASAVERVYRVKPTPGSTYYWQVEGAKIIADNNADSLVVNWNVAPGFYTIKVVERSKFGCMGDTVQGKVLVGRSFVSINGKTDICSGEAVLLTAKGALNYVWNTGETTPSILTNPLKNTTYSVVGYNESCTSDTTYHTIKVHDKPSAAFSISPDKPAPNEEVTFSYNGANASNWEWIFKNNSNILAQDSGRPNINFIYPEGGEKEVTLKVKNKAGCTDIITLRFFVDDEAYIFVPNAFTPDGDGLNDIFKPITTGVSSLEMEIYTRWGEHLKTLTSTDDSWDGFFKGKKVTEGVYLYTLKAQGTNHRWYYLNGNITVLH